MTDQRMTELSAGRTIPGLASTVKAGPLTIRVHPPAIDPTSLWAALSRTPGVGVSITDADGRLLFVNDTAMVLFSQSDDVDYEGKCIGDFHSPQYTQERMAMIGRVIAEGKPLRLTPIYHGKRIHGQAELVAMVDGHRDGLGP